MNKSSLQLVAITLWSFLIVGLYTEVNAQESTNLVPIYTGFPVKNMSWTADSQVLSFQSVNAAPQVVLSDTEWYAYDTVAASLTESKVWPQQPEALEAESIQSLELARATLTSEVFTFVSPNGRYLITDGIPEMNVDSNPSVIVDLHTRSIVPTLIPALRSRGGPDVFYIEWSADSSSFVLATAPLLINDPQFFYYVSDFAAGGDNPQIDEITSVAVNDRQYTTIEVYALSSDGIRVLVHGHYISPSLENRVSEFPLIVWDASGSANHNAIAVLNQPRSSLLDATFVHGDANKILLLGEDGILMYNVETETLEIISSDINSTWVDDARFSPDGKYLALVEQVTEVTENVYVIEIDMDQ